MNIIDIKNLTFGYEEIPIIKNLNFNLKKGEFLALIGKNGSGKSTLIKLILGELKPKKGEIFIEGERVSSTKTFDNVGYVPQVNSLSKVSFPITCLELVALNLYEELGFLKIPRKVHKEKAKKIIKEFNMGDYLNSPFNELSGGQQQRIMIARAMVKDPNLLILDEPTVGVDQKSKEDFIKLISDLNKKKDLTILLVTHELELVEDYVKDICKIEKGELKYVRV